MKRAHKVWMAGIAVILSLVCLSGCSMLLSTSIRRDPSEADMDSSINSPSWDSAASNDTQEESMNAQPENTNEEIPAVPDPARILDQATVTKVTGTELEIDGEIYLFDQYTYNFSGSKNLTDRSDFLAYQMLAQAEGLTLESLASSGTYSEYAVLWGEYLLGYLTTDQGQWILYLASDVALDSTPNGEGNGSFQNDSFGISVAPGEDVPDSSVESTLCEACDGSRRCDACGGDGVADNIYYGEVNAFPCDVCDETGICPVCEGTGVWVFD